MKTVHLRANRNRPMIKSAPRHHGRTERDLVMRLASLENTISRVPKNHRRGTPFLAIGGAAAASSKTYATTVIQGVAGAPNSHTFFENRRFRG